LEEKGGGLQAEEHHPNREARGWQHHVEGVLCCRRDWCNSQNRWHDEGENVLKQHLQTSVRKLKLGHKWVFQMDNDPNYTSKVVAKWPKDNKVKVCVSKEAYKPDSATPALSGGMGQNSPNLWEACGRLPKTFDPS
jgi:hypothetical protein